MRDIIFMLSSHGWEKIVEEDIDLSAIDRLSMRFAIPLQGAGATVEDIKTEFTQMAEYIMLQVQVSGQVYLYLLSFSSLCRHRMENLNGYFLCLELSR